MFFSFWSDCRTVDLISYTIAQIRPSVELDEAAPGSGGLCGSSFLDRKFDSWLTDHFKFCREWNLTFHADAIERWEKEIKRNFRGDVKKAYTIPTRGMGDNISLGIRGKKLAISGNVVRNLFEPVVSQILELVRKQIDQTTERGKEVKAVLMAGGFGRNEYLRNRIQKEVGDEVMVEKIKDWYALPGNPFSHCPISSLTWHTLLSFRGDVLTNP